MADLKTLKNKYLAASDGDVLGVTDNKDNVSLLGFKLAAADSLAKFNLRDGFIDAFEDTSGVDSGNSSNQIHNASKYYTGAQNSTTNHSFSITGAAETFTTPANTVSGVVKAFGANGAQYQGNGAVGQGGFVEATIPLSSSTSYTVVVGHTENAAVGNQVFYDGSKGRNNDSGGSGGFTGIFTGTDALDVDNSSSNGAATQARALVIAGGGGGAGAAWSGGYISANGGSVQSDGSGGTGANNANAGSGGTGGGQTYMSGTVGQASGGGGYNGGTAGTGGSGGGSGTNYVHSSAISITNNTGKANTSDPDETSQGFLSIVTTQQVNNNMTLISNSATAQTQPSTSDLVLTYTNGAGTATINTDLKGYISRDNGTTYTEVTLVNEGTTGGNTILAARRVDISGQPAGTSMRYKIQTFNQSAAKETRVHAVSLAWS